MYWVAKLAVDFFINSGEMREVSPCKPEKPYCFLGVLLLLQALFSWMKLIRLVVCQAIV